MSNWQRDPDYRKKPRFTGDDDLRRKFDPDQDFQEDMRRHNRLRRMLGLVLTGIIVFGLAFMLIQSCLKSSPNRNDKRITAGA
jgi:hypothetical protein